MEENLSDLSLLFVDCQANGPSPQTAAPLELGWVEASARKPDGSTPETPCSFLFSLSPGETLSPRVAALTGLTPEDLSQARPADWIWQRFLNAARPTGDGPRLAVAHYARYERPLLERLHREHGQGTAFPLSFLCTHEISRRLLADLPRRGLRALAGYFGAHLAEPKRAVAHVLATVVVWRELVSLLSEEHGIRTLGALQAWLGSAPGPSRGAKRRFRLARQSRLGLPESPGVYRMLGKGGQILYVGKATSLRERVNQHFRAPRGHSERSLELITQVWDLEVTCTETALEAALLETDEIKRSDPPYNQLLRDVQKRKLWVLSPADLSCGLASEAPAGLSLGPIAATSPPALPGLLWSAIRGPAPAAAPEALAALASPEDAALLGEALSGFLARHKTPSPAPSAWVWLLRLEQKLRLTRQQEESEASQAEEEAPALPEEADADPRERWIRFLEGWILHLGRMARRGRFLCWLADSRIVWSQPPHPAGARRAIALSSGEIRERHWAPDETVPWEGPPLLRPLAGRAAGLDLAAYDRLRVLTTELRRLAPLDPALRIFLGPRRVLDQRGLLVLLSRI